ncbi:MAG TPA: cytochrome c1 [Acetobacteraceae bacterium]|nr:cytochrome c1 [Acetobacteraceae bacterium]
MRAPYRAALAALALLAAPLLVPSARAQETPPLPNVSWSFEGPFGTFDRAALQRGFLIYKNVCSACHSMNLLYYRNLSAIGLSDAQIKAIAASVQVPTIDDSGQPAERPGTPADRFHAPFPNDTAAKAANNGAVPPDQSLLVNAREGGPTYVYAILTGYTDAPAGVTVPPGLFYNKYFPGHMIHMPPPLQADSVSYTDGVKPTLQQEAHDVTTFLTWAANPNMEERKRMGVKVVLFLVFLTGITYAVKRRVWADVH